VTGSRIEPFAEALHYIAGHERVWRATGREIARHFMDTSWEAFSRAAGALQER
jgi:hypothetical protein